MLTSDNLKRLGMPSKKIDDDAMSEFSGLTDATDLTA